MKEEVEEYIWNIVSEKRLKSSEIYKSLELAENEFNIKFYWQEHSPRYDRWIFNITGYEWGCILPNGELYIDSVIEKFE